MHIPDIFVLKMNLLPWHFDGTDLWIHEKTVPLYRSEQEISLELSAIQGS